MNRLSASIFMVLASICCSSLVVAQVISPNVRFLEAPELGDLVPDLVLVDDQGNPANLREITEGHYTVMTLGCLT